MIMSVPVILTQLSSSTAITHSCSYSYVPVPVGVVGPLVIDSKPFRIPMATTEGALIASTNRGARAIELSGGAQSVIMGVGMTRAPLLRGPSFTRAAALKKWVETPENAAALAAAFNSTSRYVVLFCDRVHARIDDDDELFDNWMDD